MVKRWADGVAVEIAHHLALGGERAGAGRTAFAGEFGEQVRTARIIGLLFGGVGVVLVGGVGLAAIQPERGRGGGAVGGGGVGIARQQPGVGQRVGARRAGGGGEGGLTGDVGGLGVGREIMVERDVLVEQHDEVLDRRGGLGVRRLRGAAGGDAGQEQAGGNADGGQIAG
jgi:hypothetical protein